ncbi:hypothetical protein B0H13DRAFT_2300190 [Mycena leptocephala]|nr:hypothetical protein B0H13DRAFT_2300190 [Mycena leptocephala]
MSASSPPGPDGPVLSPWRPFGLEIRSHTSLTPEVLPPKEATATTKTGPATGLCYEKWPSLPDGTPPFDGYLSAVSSPPVHLTSGLTRSLSRIWIWATFPGDGILSPPLTGLIQIAVILWDLKLIIRFPPGSTILIPSAIIRHSNMPVDAHELRFSFTQYTAGSLFRWIRNSFKTDEASELTALQLAIAEPRLVVTATTWRPTWSPENPDATSAMDTIAAGAWAARACREIYYTKVSTKVAQQFRTNGTRAKP